MEDRRVIAALILMAFAAIIGKLIDLWHVNSEPILLDTQTNGGVVSGSANSTAKVTWR